MRRNWASHRVVIAWPRPAGGLARLVTVTSVIGCRLAGAGRTFLFVRRGGVPAVAVRARVVRVFAAVVVLVSVSVAGLGGAGAAVAAGRPGLPARVTHRPLPLGTEQALARAKAAGRPVAVAA